jgi:cyclophilin family peptidyl-prolyl cis-trans isomerase
MTAAAALALLIACLLPSTSALASPEETEAALPPVKEEVAILKTNQGEIVLRFFPDVAPGHVKQFKFHAANGVYDNTTFHRVIPSFMIQGGDPNSKDADRNNDGLGGAGKPQKAEFSEITHRRGILSTARKPNSVDSATSQFFIMVGDMPGLDRQYTVFGMVVSGMETADRIVALPRDSRDNPLPANPAVIQKIVFETREIPARPAWTLPARQAAAAAPAPAAKPAATTPAKPPTP